MSYSQENGYTPLSIVSLMDLVRINVNEETGQSYTAETFLGTNLYKSYYALIQLLQENEVKTSEIFEKLKGFISLTNETISRPVGTPQGIIDRFATEGYTASVKPPLEADAGTLFVCIDVDDEAEDYADTRLELCTILKDSVQGGIVTDGTETESLTLTNGQSFDYSFNLPTRVEPLLKLTIETSENNQEVIKGPDEIKSDLMANIAARYKLGKNFEPQRYYSLVDAPWAASVLLEYSTDSGANWYSVVYETDYDELFTILLANITLVEA